MTFTPAQKAVILANIQSIPAVNQMYVDGDLPWVANYYNTVAAPEYIVWKTYVTRDEVMLNGFDWTRVDNLSIGKARIWDWMFTTGAINPSKSNIREGIDQTWAGTQADLAVRAAVYVHCKRPATRIEQLLASGSGTTLSPSTMPENGEGPAAWQDFQNLA